MDVLAVIFFAVAVGLSWVFRSRSLSDCSTGLITAAEEAARILLLREQKMGFQSACQANLLLIGKEVMRDVQVYEHKRRRQLEMLHENILIKPKMAFVAVGERHARRGVETAEAKARKRLVTTTPPPPPPPVVRLPEKVEKRAQTIKRTTTPRSMSTGTAQRSRPWATSLRSTDPNVVVARKRSPRRKNVPLKRPPWKVDPRPPPPPMVFRGRSSSRDRE
eukprot:TRINITY_DN34055_c0_g1_i1.p1 TRINITY_DN34055_c0_g1~~TRINITY_DN34055_c0_g1_i1.p1  ORF type:complete len:220 (+),score=17.46 TRINITY_DN34055_c0_g1_i1:37-696(+)